MCIVANTPLMHYHFPYVGADLCKLDVQSATSEHCKCMDTGWCIMRRVCSLPKLSPSTH